MKRFKLSLSTLVFLGFTFLFSCKSYQKIFQSATSKTILLSAIKGNTSKTDTIFFTSNKKEVALISSEVKGTHKDFWKIKLIPTGEKKSIILTINFQPQQNFIGAVKDSLILNFKNQKEIVYKLRGLSTKALEGKNEPPLYDIVQLLDYNINLGWSGLSNTTNPKLQGDELSQTLFVKAGNKAVKMVPIARYSPAFKLPFGYYTRDNDVVKKHEVGILAGSKNYPEHQTLHPKLLVGKTSFNPEQSKFGFYTTSPSHTAYSQDKYNKRYHKKKAAHAVRIYEVKDKTGNKIANEYLVCFEEAKNGDYQDYVFIVKNIKAIAD
ncbi:hypothetical protein [uncultured Polaribacter sp.]|uniref:hypothetical protein n=1 Tax=uncultured Polaribacter sp. TaxID=174711 RepID=UPI00261E38E7|nr:hypothetical protein [uncultured Polaribacter sp.]